MGAHLGFQKKEGIPTYIFTYAVTEKVKRYLKPMCLQMSGIPKLRRNPHLFMYVYTVTEEKYSCKGV